MNTFFQHTYASNEDAESSLLRGSFLETEDFDKLLETRSVGNSRFGKNSKDVVEFSVYSPQNELFGWTLVDQTPNYITKQFSYKTPNGELINKTISYLDSLYPTTADGGVLVSPKYELEKLGITQGEFKVKISYRNDIVGSFENPYKFIIDEISPSRTELRVLTQSLKNSQNPDAVAFNFEYENFTKKQVVVGQLIDRLSNLLKEELFVSELETKKFSSSASDYASYVKKVESAYSMTEYQMLNEIDQIYLSLVSFYKNFLLGSLTDVFDKDRFYSEYINCIDYTLNNFSRFIQEKNEDVKLFYKYMLMQMFDSDLLDSVFNERFNNYLSSLINFGNGYVVPVVTYKSYTDEKLSNSSNDVLLIKLLKPLDGVIDVGTNFYLSQSLYSDDIVKSIILRNTQTNSNLTFKLRGPDISQKITNETTKKYTLNGEENGLLPGEDLKSAEQYFQTTGKEVTNLNIDYTNFKNFVKFSSARSRLDNFVLKLTKISKVKQKINEFNRTINSIDNKLSLGELDESVALNSISLLRAEDIKKLNEEMSDVISTFTPYEKYLYYEDGNNSWPRETSFSLYGFTGLLFTANGEYKIHASRKYDLDKVFLNEVDINWSIVWDSLVNKWRLFNDNLDVYIYSNTQNLSSGFTAKNLSDTTTTNHKGFDGQESAFSRILIEEEYKDKLAIFPPALIPSNIDDFKKTEGWGWYKSKASEADLYDKYNDDSLRNSIPEFLVRTNENSDFTSFLHMIGEQFDILIVYIEAMTDMANVRNSFSKGVPNQLVWFVMNSLGVNFTGRVVDELSISKVFEKNRNTVWRRILNNLPYILKSSGTEESLRALFKCYGIPDFLFSIREYGGVKYGTDTSDDARYRLDTHDYSLQFTDESQYIEVPLQPNKIKKDSISIEARVSIDLSTFSDPRTTKTFNKSNYGQIPANYGSVVNIDELIETDDFIIGSEKPRFYSKRKEDPSYVHPKNDNENDIGLSWKNLREGVSFAYPIVSSGTSPAFMTIYSDEAKNKKRTKLTSSAKVGDTRLSINNEMLEKFKKGDVLVLSRGLPNEEHIEIINVNLFEIKNPLKNDHSVGSVVEDNSYDPLYTIAEIGAQDTLNGETVRLLFNQDLSEDNRNNGREFFVDFTFNGTQDGTHYTLSELRDSGASSANESGMYPMFIADAWEFGIYRDEAKFPEGYGKFYFNLNNSDGVMMCPSELSDPIYLGKKMNMIY